MVFPAPAPPKGLLLGFGVSPLLGAPKPLKRPPGLLADVPGAPPPKTLDELVALLPVPKRPAPGALEVAPDANRGGIGELLPNRVGLGALLPLFWPLFWPKENDMLEVVERCRSEVEDAECSRSQAQSC